jgi:hypothetical protein
LRKEKHLHIDSKNPLIDLFTKALKATKEGQINIIYQGQPAAQVRMKNDNIEVDLLDPPIFKPSQDQTGIFDKLKTAKEFGEKLAQEGVTISFLRKGKEAIKLGREAEPSLSKIITKSDDIQISSLKELAKLSRDLDSD